MLIYFIAGLLYNKIHKGVSSFPEMIPNHSFWGDVPFLVKVRSRVYVTISEIVEVFPFVVVLCFVWVI